MGTELTWEDEGAPAFVNEETIWQFVENDLMKFTMIEFKFVSKSFGTRFISNGSDFTDLIDSSIWLRLGHRLVDDFFSDQWICRFLQKGKTFCPSNIYYSGPRYHPKNATDLQIDLHISSRTVNGVHGSVMISRRWKSHKVTIQSFLVRPVRAPTRSPGVWKYKEMVNHGLKSIDAKTTLI
jgi:hypothetical protein